MDTPVVKMRVLRTCWIGDDIVEEGTVINVTMETAKRYINLGAGSLRIPEAVPVAPVSEEVVEVVEIVEPTVAPAAIVIATKAQAKKK